MILFHQTFKSRIAAHPAFATVSEIDGNLTTGNDSVIATGYSVSSELKFQQTLKTSFKY